MERFSAISNGKSLLLSNFKNKNKSMLRQLFEYGTPLRQLQLVLHVTVQFKQIINMTN